MRHVLALLAVVAAVACRLTAAYLLIATEDDPPGHVLFNASLGGRGPRTYAINNHRSASFVHRLLRVDPDTGRISLRHYLDCTAVYYPNLFTLHVDSTALADPVDYYSLPLRVFVSGRRCERDPLVSIDLADEAEEQDVALNRVHVKVSEAKRWVSETLASYAIPNNADGEAAGLGADWTRICLRKSQLVCRIRNLLPRTVVSNNFSCQPSGSEDRSHTSVLVALMEHYHGQHRAPLLVQQGRRDESDLLNQSADLLAVVGERNFERKSLSTRRLGGAGGFTSPALIPRERSLLRGRPSPPPPP
ncbi:Protocadherin-like wing polarity protein stan [Frankliniella fusca]|uniref:Protocadherin-like wing polarity protein stan n=1 Tax=Frankliniella fusca TaxID=407009 RepID=A0AAE1LTX2_9NEOP|nr:Protocadherin-like wing polarity protein stan [Frankliniella fusca]